MELAHQGGQLTASEQMSVTPEGIVQANASPPIGPLQLTTMATPYPRGAACVCELREFTISMIYAEGAWRRMPPVHRRQRAKPKKV